MREKKEMKGKDKKKVRRRKGRTTEKKEKKGKYKRKEEKER